MKYCDVCHSTYPTEFTSCPKDKATLRPLHELAPGMVIRDKYEILERIGVGGMATVYKARHLTFGEIRAIKVVSNKLVDDENFLKRFKAEAIITRKLRHPNAVQLDDFDTMADGRPFIVMEFVQGRSLRSWINDLRTLPPARALNITKQVASALGAAHKLGIVHRDIKPDNIIVIPQPAPPGSGSAGDQVKVFDFGIAKIRGGTTDISSGTPTQTGMVVGTPQYVSPEQASGKIGDQIDGRSDLYSLGVVLYEMLTGHLPFTSDTPVGFLIHHMQTAPTPPQALRPAVHLPESLTALLMRALEKNRDRRFQTAEEFIASMNKPHVVAAATAVLGSDALNAPTAATRRQGPPSATAARAASATAARAAAAPARPAVPKHLSPVASSAVPRTAAGAHRSPAAAAVHTPPPKPEGTVYQEAEETAWQTRRVPAGSQLPWKKIAIAAGLVIVLLLGGIGVNRIVQNRAAQNQALNPQEDARIKQEIADAFANSDSLKDRKLEIAVSNGEVTLRGRVDKPYLTEIAGALARDVSGVRYVKNEIEIIEAQETKEPVWRSAASGRSDPATPSASAQPSDDYGAAGQPARNFDLNVIRTRERTRQFVMRGYKRLSQDDFLGAQRAFENALKLDSSNRMAQEGLRRAKSGRR